MHILGGVVRAIAAAPEPKAQVPAEESRPPAAPNAGAMEPVGAAAALVQFARYVQRQRELLSFLPADKVSGALELHLDSNLQISVDPEILPAAAEGLGPDPLDGNGEETKGQAEEKLHELPGDGHGEQQAPSAAAVPTEAPPPTRRQQLLVDIVRSCKHYIAPRPAAGVSHSSWALRQATVLETIAVALRSIDSTNQLLPALAQLWPLYKLTLVARPAAESGGLTARSLLIAGESAAAPAVGAGAGNAVAGLLSSTADDAKQTYRMLALKSLEVLQAILDIPEAASFLSARFANDIWPALRCALVACVRARVLTSLRDFAEGSCRLTHLICRAHRQLSLALPRRSPRSSASAC